MDVKDRNFFIFILIRLLIVIAIFYPILKYFNILYEPLKLFGLFIFIKWIIPHITLFYKKLKRKLSNKSMVERYGNWAIITGATGGIGYEYAKELAKKKFNLLLISRNPKKLEDMCIDFKDKYSNIEVQYIAFDFSNKDEEDNNNFYQLLKETIQEILKNPMNGIGILINNVGIANENPNLFLDVPEEETFNMLHINVQGTVKMTHTVLPFMLLKHKGGILNVSSASGNHPTPYLSIYAATKAFVTRLSTSIAFEYKSQGIDCLVITPYYFVSGMYKRRRGSFLAPLASVVAKDSLPLLGLVEHAYPYIGHAVLGWVARVYWDTSNALLKMMIRNKRRAEMKAKERAQKNNKKKD